MYRWHHIQQLSTVVLLVMQCVERNCDLAVNIYHYTWMMFLSYQLTSRRAFAGSFEVSTCLTIHGCVVGMSRPGWREKVGSVANS